MASEARQGARAGATAEAWRDDVIAMIPALRAFAWSLSHNASDADDLVQDTLIKAWTNREKFELGTNLRAWLFTILRNTYYTAIVRRRREVRDEDGAYAATLTSPANQDWSLAVGALETALRRLPDEHREALILVGAGGFSYEDAAEICNCAVGTVKSRVARARKALIAILDGDEALPASDRPAEGEAARDIMAQLDALAPGPHAAKPKREDSDG